MLAMTQTVFVFCFFFLCSSRAFDYYLSKKLASEMQILFCNNFVKRLAIVSILSRYCLLARSLLVINFRQFS